MKRIYDGQLEDRGVARTLRTLALSQNAFCACLQCFVKFIGKVPKLHFPPNSSPLTRAFLNPVEVDPTIGHKQIIRSVISQDASYMAFRASTVNVQGR
jgi:hypothetical protein